MADGNPKYFKKIKLILSIPTIIAFFGLINLVTGNIFLTIIIVMMVLILLAFIPLEHFILWFDNHEKQVLRIINFIKIPFFGMILVGAVVIVVFWSLNIGNPQFKEVFSEITWPFYYEKTFAGKALCDRTYLEHYKGQDKVVEILFVNYQDTDADSVNENTGYGGWIAGLGSKPFKKGPLKYLIPNSNFSAFEYFSFFIRSESPNKKYELKFKDITGYEEAFLIDNIPCDKWKNIEIKLSETFPNINFNDIENFSLSTNEYLSQNKSRVLIANISAW